MPLAIQEDMLPGINLVEKFQQAAALGFQGIEVWVDEDLTERVPEIAAASEITGVRVSAVNIGHTRLIHPEYAIRDEALVAMRKAMTAAVDLGAQGVVFKPFYAPGPVLPDLHPYKSSLELEAELLVTQLRATLCDLAYALGTQLLIQPANHEETHLIRKVEHAVVIQQKLDHHPHLKIAANLYHMAVEGEDIGMVFSHHGDNIGYVYLSDTDHTLPGNGTTDFNRVTRGLRESGYTGWLTLECGTPGHNSVDSEKIFQNLPLCLQTLREFQLS
jgi:sugar phosphate isomerase/epimerase